MVWVISLFVNIVSLFHTTYENTYLWNLLIAPELIFDNRILIFGQYLKDYSFQAKQLLINLRKGGVSPILAMSESRAKEENFSKVYAINTTADIAIYMSHFYKFQFNQWSFSS